MPEPAGPVDGRRVPRYAGPGSFARLPEIDRVPDYDIAVLGVPFDGGTSYRPGARFGPMAVRQASRHLRPGHHVELGCAPFGQAQVVDAGDVAVTPFSIDEAVRQIRAGDVDDLGVPGTVEAIAARVSDLPAYLSIDIDVLDPSAAPGTGTPEAGGLTSRELLRMLRGLTALNLVGADVVEVAPAYDHAEITAIAAATVIFDIVALLGRRTQPLGRRT